MIHLGSVGMWVRIRTWDFGLDDVRIEAMLRLLRHIGMLSCHQRKLQIIRIVLMFLRIFIESGRLLMSVVESFD